MLSRMKAPRTRTLPARLSHLVEGCPNFSRTGSIVGMRKQFYGNSAQLIRCGQFIYNISGAHNFSTILSASK